MINKKVFVCDDNPDIVEIIEIVLSQYPDVEVWTETKSLNAISHMEQKCPDILIVDLSMPGMTGDQLIKKVRSNDLLKHLFIICMSANLDGKEVALVAGANVFLSKPFDLNDFLDAVYSFETYKKGEAILI